MYFGKNGSSSTRYPRGHRAKRNSEALGNILIAKAFHVKQQHGFSLSFGQFVHGRAQLSFATQLIHLFIERWAGVGDPVVDDRGRIAFIGGFVLHTPQGILSGTMVV